MLVGKVEASKRVVRAMPDSPLSRRFHTPSMEWPIGVTQPIPVMTTRFMGVQLAVQADALRSLSTPPRRGKLCAAPDLSRGRSGAAQSLPRRGRIARLSTDRLEHQRRVLSAQAINAADRN